MGDVVVELVRPSEAEGRYCTSPYPRNVYHGSENTEGQLGVPGLNARPNEEFPAGLLPDFHRT